jgi:uncharacterized Zn finger protein (UPF0148 family)
MTPPDATTQDVCPICGSTLVRRGQSLYCPSCDLYYEAGDDETPDTGSDRVDPE